MKKKIEINLPSVPRIYEEIKFVARVSDNYDPRKSAEGLAELFECLYDYIPNEIIEKLRADPRTINLRKRLERRV